MSYIKEANIEYGEILADMQDDIRVDIHGDIYGHERYAKELAFARAELRHLRAKIADQSWALSPDRSGGQFTDQEISESRGEQW